MWREARKFSLSLSLKFYPCGFNPRRQDLLKVRRLPAKGPGIYEYSYPIEEGADFPFIRAAHHAGQTLDGRRQAAGRKGGGISVETAGLQGTVYPLDQPGLIVCQVHSITLPCRKLRTNLKICLAF